jgi:predicted metal-dependent enzyme (double-stranded beta helix superfamily)
MAQADVLDVDRKLLVDDVVNVVKVLTAKGVNRQVLKSVAHELERLAAHEEMFKRTEFPPPAGDTNVLYSLSCDADGRYALYLSSANVGKSTPPHNHATWAVIVGIEGDELNLLYERTDDGSRPGKADIRKVGEYVVTKGSPICLMPEDIHSIHVRGTRPTFHLHMYGRRLPDLADRLQFDLETGEARHFPPNPNIR